MKVSFYMTDEELDRAISRYNRMDYVKPLFLHAGRWLDLLLEIRELRRRVAEDADTAARSER